MSILKFEICLYLLLLLHTLKCIRSHTEYYDSHSAPIALSHSHSTAGLTSLVPIPHYSR